MMFRRYGSSFAKRLGVTAMGALDLVAVGRRTHGYNVVQVNV